MYLPTSILVCGVACFCFFAALTILSQIYPGVDGNGNQLTQQNPVVALVFFGFACLGAVITLQYFIERHHFDGWTLEYRTLTRRGALVWRDISRISYSPSLKWFRLETSDGRVIRVSVMLKGLPDFARTVLTEVPINRIDAPAQSLLDSCSRGELPSLWR
jgi:hypothetical protein